MNVVLLAFQFIGPALVGLAVARYLRTVTMRLLSDLCGTADRAEFWVRASTAVMVIAPLALVMMAARSPLDCLASDAICLETALRHTLVFTLIGALATIGAIVVAVGRYLPARVKPLLNQGDTEAGA